MRASESQIAATIAANFEGDAELYAAFASACDAQFLRDAEAGNGAADEGRLQALRRLAHDLKSALLMLGCDDASQLASEVEQSAERGEMKAARIAWRQLSRVLSHAS